MAVVGHDAARERGQAGQAGRPGVHPGHDPAVGHDQRRAEDVGLVVEVVREYAAGAVGLAGDGPDGGAGDAIARDLVELPMQRARRSARCWPLLTADKYISLVSLMILAFGLSFEFPVILVFLLIARVLTTRQLRQWRRYAAVIIVTFAAVITPSQDPYSLFAMAIPMYLFYELCIIIGRIMKR